jgi:prepilin-type N-terminal cleavage/methylation domain-containing protein
MKNNNKGFSLIEVLIVVAISSVVMLLATSLIVNSSRIYNKESTNIDLSNEAQLIVNNLNEAFMEATKLEVEQDGDSCLIKLGDYYTEAEKDESAGIYAYDSKNKALCRNVLFNSDTQFLGLIVNSKFLDEAFITLLGDTSEQLDGYRLSTVVSNFQIACDPSCVIGTTNVTSGGTTESKPAIQAPVKVLVKFTLTTKTGSGEYEISMQLRNSLDKVTLPQTIGASPTEFYVVNR